MTTHMIIPDAHAKPTVNNNRFEWLGHLALERRPEVIIDIGDWADMPSLCSYDYGKKSFEGRRYYKDIKAARDARERFWQPFAEHNRLHPKDQYHPRLIALGGNHDEGRITRVTEMHPELFGTISINDFGYKEYGWEYIPFLKPYKLDGILYSHYFPSGVKNLPIGGEHPAATILKKMFMSCISGHSHVRDFSERTRADGKKIASAIVGCYFEHREAYTGGTDVMWYRGVFFANNVREGAFDPEWISLSQIKKIYG